MLKNSTRVELFNTGVRSRLVPQLVFSGVSVLPQPFWALSPGMKRSVAELHYHLA
jgi:hypothetical protein